MVDRDDAVTRDRPLGIFQPDGGTLHFVADVIDDDHGWTWCGLLLQPEAFDAGAVTPCNRCMALWMPEDTTQADDEDRGWGSE